MLLSAYIIILLINIQGEVCLLKGHNVFVPGNKLRQLINESKVKGPTHLLQKLIPLVFTVEELANSCGQGISSTTNSKTQLSGGDLIKKPLDQTKTRVLKGRSYCILYSNVFFYGGVCCKLQVQSAVPAKEQGGLGRGHCPCCLSRSSIEQYLMLFSLFSFRQTIYCRFAQQMRKIAHSPNT